VAFADRTQLRKLLTELEVQLRQLLESYETGRLLRDGVRTVLIGKPNAGKSTLLNRLIGRDRAIVSEVAGTTRDTIEADWTYRGVYFRLIDTAGLRETEDVIEAEGVRRTRKAIEEADVVMLLEDLREPGNVELRTVLDRTFPDKPMLFIGNKVDTIEDPELFSGYDLLISAAENQGIDELKARLLEKALGRVDTDSGSLVITSTRHRDALEKALAFVSSAHQHLEDGSSNEFLSIDLRSALQELGHITGEITNEDILDSIFSRFCIGK
jgi:tRNA modification GTPase